MGSERVNAGAVRALATAIVLAFLVAACTGGNDTPKPARRPVGRPVPSVLGSDPACVTAVQSSAWAVRGARAAATRAKAAGQRVPSAQTVAAWEAQLDAATSTFVSTSSACQAAGPCAPEFIDAGLAVSTAILLLRAERVLARAGGDRSTRASEAVKRYPGVIEQASSQYDVDALRCHPSS